MRIALIGSPRSGNTWIRSVICRAAGLEHLAVHNYHDLPASLPERCILGIHWPREPNFQCFLRENGFRVVALARHPLDVLISALGFIRHEPLTQRWLEGNCAIPDSLAGKSPVSDEFLQYALSFGAENLLSISYQWWHEPAAICVCYEDFVRSPREEFAKLMSALNLVSGELDSAVKFYDLEWFKALPNHHGWQGRPGLWRDLIPASLAWRIYARHRKVFRTEGYSIRPRLLLRRGTAERNWQQLDAAS